MLPDPDSLDDDRASISSRGSRTRRCSHGTVARNNEHHDPKRYPRVVCRSARANHDHTGCAALHRHPWLGFARMRWAWSSSPLSCPACPPCLSGPCLAPATTSTSRCGAPSGSVRQIPPLNSCSSGPSTPLCPSSPPPSLSPRSSLPLALSKKMAPPPAPGAEADNHDLGAAFADDAAMDFLNEVEKLAEDEKGARSAGVR